MLHDGLVQVLLGKQPAGIGRTHAYRIGGLSFVVEDELRHEATAAIDLKRAVVNIAVTADQRPSAGWHRSPALPASGQGDFHAPAKHE